MGLTSLKSDHCQSRRCVENLFNNRRSRLHAVLLAAFVTFIRKRAAESQKEGLQPTCVHVCLNTAYKSTFKRSFYVFEAAGISQWSLSQCGVK